MSVFPTGQRVLALFAVGDVYVSICKKSAYALCSAGQSRERYFGCNLMQRKVLASSHGVVAPLWLRGKSAYGGGRGMFEHEVSQALPVQAREAEEVPRSQLADTTKGCAAGAI